MNICTLLSYNLLHYTFSSKLFMNWILVKEIELDLKLITGYLLRDLSAMHILLIRNIF